MSCLKKVISLWALLVRNSDPKVQFEGVSKIRQILSVPQDAPIETVLELGIVPDIIKLTRKTKNAKLQFECLWLLTNIASGTPQQTKALFQCGALPVFVKLLSSPQDAVAEQALWALGNLAGDGVELRDCVLEANIVPRVVTLIEEKKPLSLLRVAAWSMSNLCRSKPAPPFEVVRPLIKGFAHLLNTCDDPEVQADSLWGLSYLSEGPPEQIEAVLQCDANSRVLQSLASANVDILHPALRVVGNFLAGSPAQAQALLDRGTTDILMAILLSNPRRVIQKEVCWIMSNITGGTPDQLQVALNAGLVPHLIRLACSPAAAQSPSPMPPDSSAAAAAPDAAGGDHCGAARGIADPPPRADGGEGSTTSASAAAIPSPVDLATIPATSTTTSTTTPTTSPRPPSPFSMPLAPSGAPAPPTPLLLPASATPASFPSLPTRATASGTPALSSGDPATSPTDSELWQVQAEAAVALCNGCLIGREDQLRILLEEGVLGALMEVLANPYQRMSILRRVASCLDELTAAAPLVLVHLTRDDHWSLLSYLETIMRRCEKQLPEGPDRRAAHDCAVSLRNVLSRKEDGESLAARIREMMPLIAQLNFPLSSDEPSPFSSNVSLLSGGSLPPQPPSQPHDSPPVR
ncbi:putative Importin subunit alpha-1a [Paratrimastix pyriformis]|uniref:Importin subunit alpha-1a n=1 Tax=Paratrimastix pyriformis TaxID=342808 RepID=A0ABQ8UTA8_9EUKA|nr:putative Importin subunit alpha-1a [Paratrimastix pyriformis]